MSKPNLIRVVVVGIGEYPKVRTIKNTLEAMQSIVGGYITCPSLDAVVEEEMADLFKDLDIVANDDTTEPVSWQFNPEFGILGTFFVARVNPKTGDYIDLTDSDIENLLHYFRPNQQT